MDINGWTALITGASSGIGAEFARQLHALGSDVLLVARREERLRSLEVELNSRRGSSARYFAADLTDFSPHSSQGMIALLEWLKEQRVDLLINNAGCGSFGRFEDLDISSEMKMVDLNIRAGMQLAHALVPHMKRRGRGGIISVSSLAAFQPLPFMATYAASKVFNLFHSLALRQELRGSGLGVMAVCPGPTATEFGGVARVPGTLTGISRDSVQMVVAESLRAFHSGRAFVFPGRRAWLLSLLLRWLPLGFTCWLTWRILRPALDRAPLPRKGRTEIPKDRDGGSD